jgi:hypothetical protein
MDVYNASSSRSRPTTAQPHAYLASFFILTATEVPVKHLRCGTRDFAYQAPPLSLACIEKRSGSLRTRLVGVYSAC